MKFIQKFGLIFASVIVGVMIYFSFIYLYIYGFGGFGNLERWRTISNFYTQQYNRVADQSVLFLGSSYFLEGINANIVEEILENNNISVQAYNLSTTAATPQEEILHYNYINEKPARAFVVMLTPETLIKCGGINPRKRVLFYLLGFKPPENIKNVLSDEDAEYFKYGFFKVLIDARFLLRDNLDHSFRLLLRNDFRDNSRDLKIANNYTTKFSTSAIKKMAANIEKTDLLPIASQNINIINAFLALSSRNTYVVFVIPPIHPSYLKEQHKDYSIHFENEVNNLIKGYHNVALMNLLEALDANSFVDLGHVDENGRNFMTTKISEHLANALKKIERI